MVFCMRYEPMRGGRFLIPAMFGLFAIVAVALVASTLFGGSAGPPVGFTILWLFAMAWNAYWFLTRFAIQLSIDGGSLCWSAPVRSGRVLISEIVEVRPMRFASNVEVFVCRGRRPILVMATKGLRAFSDELVRQRADLPVRLGWQAKIAEWMPGRTHFRP